MYGFRVILRNTFAPGDLDTVINQLVFQGQEDLEQFVDDRDLFIRVVGEIMTEFNMQQPSSAIASHEVGSLGTEEAEGDKKWIRCHGVGAVHWIFFFSARAGLGSSSVTRNNNVFIERNSLFFSCVCLLASMARSVNCLGRKKAVQVHLIGAKPIVQVKR